MPGTAAIFIDGAYHPRLDNLIDILESMRRLAARSNPPRQGQVDAFDGILGTLRTVRDARAPSSHG